MQARKQRHMEVSLVFFSTFEPINITTQSIFVAVAVANTLARVMHASPFATALHDSIGPRPAAEGTAAPGRRGPGPAAQLPLNFRISTADIIQQ